MIITVDGPSGAGKSTVGRLLAIRLGLHYVDTGALYRAVAWWILVKGLDPENEEDLQKACSEIPLRVDWDDDGKMRVLCGPDDVSEAIRTDEIGMLASRISTRRVVREKLWNVQRALGSRGSMVFEGRDMGSHVFPDAKARFFVTASLGERAHRRSAQLAAMGQEVALQEVQKKMAVRDQQDALRAIAPLKVPEGAIVIDTTVLGPEEVVDRMIQAIRKVNSNP